MTLNSAYERMVLIWQIIDQANITQWLKNLAEFRFKIVLIARKVGSRYGFRTILIRELSPIQALFESSDMAKNKMQETMRSNKKKQRRGKKERVGSCLSLLHGVPVWGTIAPADNGAKRCRHLITTQAPLTTALSEIKYETHH